MTQLSLFESESAAARGRKAGVSVADRMNDYDGFVG